MSFTTTSLICCEITILYKTMVKSMTKGEFRPSQLRNSLIDFDEFRRFMCSIRGDVADDLFQSLLCWVVACPSYFTA